MAASPPRSRTIDLLAQSIVSGLILTLVLVRYFDVVESAAQGDTLWIVALWLLAGLAWLATRRTAPCPALIQGWLDLAVSLLCGGHLLAALAVIATSGDKRAAINLAWEWSGVLVCWFLVRGQCRIPAFRRELGLALIATAAVTAGLGLYQHYIEFPRLASKYGPLFDELKKGDPWNAAAIRQQLAKDHVPLDEAGLTLFEKRLRDSQEPLGLFALANSLGGVLAACLVFVIGLAAAEIRLIPARRNWLRRGTWLLIVLLLGWCLLLTKSRTAFIGGFAGLAMLVISNQQFRWTRLHWGIGAIGIALVLGIGWGMSRFGSLDRQVITEAPKSLQYRLQYWAATWQIIQRHPWLGVGPGQFRSNYLIYRLPDASEEISDPHNFVLDVAANGGIVALAGLALLCLWLVRFPQPTAEGEGVDENPESSRVRRLTVVGLAALAWCGLLTGYDDRLLILIPVCVALFWGLDRGCADGFDAAVWRRCSRAAAVALMFHLCGAGGIGMPGICILWLVFYAVADGRSISAETRLATSQGTRHKVLSAVVCGVALVGVSWTGMIPVYSSQTHLRKADQACQVPGKQAEAMAEYRLAAAADGWSAEPWRKLANLSFSQAAGNQFRSNELFQAAVDLMHESCLRDPLKYHDWQTLGEWWLGRWRITKDPGDARESMQEMERAWALCPTSSLTMAQLAFARAAAESDQTAREMAALALKQDDLNHKNQHVDRYLNESTRTALEKMVLR